MNDYPGKFIVFDGPDGSGKTLQSRAAISYLREKGKCVTYLREPGGTQIGEAVRSILLDSRYSEMTPRTELLLYNASRAQLVDQRIVPALEKGNIVVSDRFFPATFAYQLCAGDLPKEEGLHVINFAVDGILPDLAMIFDVSPEVGFSRLGKNRDRIEQKDIRYHGKVRQGFLEYTKLNPENTIIIDASRTIEEVQIDVQRILEERILN